MSCYLVQETDGTSRFTLEDASGFLLLESCVGPPAGTPIRSRLPRERRLRRDWDVPVTVEDLEEEDDAILVMLEGL